MAVFLSVFVRVWRKTAPHLKEKGTEILKLQNSDWKNVGAKLVLFEIRDVHNRNNFWPVQKPGQKLKFITVFLKTLFHKACLVS